MSLFEAARIVLTGYRLELAASVLVGVACGLVGCFIILRRMALIGDALSHAVLPGVVAAFILFGTAPGVMFAGAMTAGLAAAFLIGFVHRNSRVKEDSSIGIVFTAFFAVGVILISSMPRGVHFDLKCFLFGDPLAVQPDHLKMMALVSILVAAAIALFFRPLQLTSFDPAIATAMGLNAAWMHYLLMGLLSATVVASLQAVGVIMAVAMIVAPGSTAYQLTDRLGVMLWLAAALGALSAGLGFVLAFAFNWPAGPAMTLVAGGFFLLAMLVSPKYGVAFRHLRRVAAHRHYMLEDALKTAIKLGGENVPIRDLNAKLALSKGQSDRLLGILKRMGAVRLSDAAVSLTEDGRRHGLLMLRSHRLWETYLVERMQAPAEAVHEEAELLEHAHHLSDKLSEALGSPAMDPHGRIIPPGGGVES